MRSRKTLTTKAAHAPQRGWHQAFAVLALVFFAFQSYVTQTHIHLLWQGAPDAFVQAIAAAPHLQKQTPDKLPPGNNPATCPICQDMLLAGHFTSPAGIALFLPARIAVAPAILLASPSFVGATSHSWYGRAPPQH